MSSRPLALFKLALLFLAQNILSYWFPGNAPSLLLIGVMAYSLKEGPRFGLMLGLFAGALLEIFGQGALGGDMIRLAAIGLLSGFFASKIFQDGAMTEILFPVVATYCVALAEIVTGQLSIGAPFEGAWLGLAFRPWMMAGTVLASPLVFSFIQKRSGRAHGYRTR